MVELQIIQQLQEEIRELKTIMVEQQARIEKLEQGIKREASLEATVLQAAPLLIKQNSIESNDFYSEDTFWGEIPTPTSEQIARTRDFAMESHGLTHSIEDGSGRDRFLIGKQVGSDLIDSSGNLIALENTVITPEIIDKARERGMLAYLIVNMKLPD